MVEQIVHQDACDGNDMSGRKGARPLWLIWWNAVSLLRPAFSRESAFMWFAVIMAGFTVRPDMLGVSSFMRALNLRDCCYDALLRNFHSTAISLDHLTALWVRAVLRLFSNPVRINGCLILVADGTKAPKRGKKMPGVKRLHQQSECNNKAEWIMGHVCHRNTIGRNLKYVSYARDEGKQGPFGVGFQERASNHSMLLRSRVVVVSDGAKSLGKLEQVWIRETNVSEPSMRRRDISMSSKPGAVTSPGISLPETWILGRRRPA